VRNTRIAVARECARGLLAACVAAAFAATNAHAQQLPDPAAELRRQQERSQAQKQQIQGPSRDVAPQAPAPVPVPNAPRLPANESPCFAITHIDISEVPQAGGASSASSSFAWIGNAISGPANDDTPIGKCVGAQGIGVVLKRAQDALVAKGLVTSRAVAQPQDLSTGHLVLDIVPGRVHAIRFAQDSDRKAWFNNARNGVPIQTGDILNLRDIEQAFENFKRVPTVEADIKIVPAENSPDQSDLVILHQQSTLYRFSVTMDDAGSKSTGKYQGGATLSLDNPLGLSDLFYFTLNHDLGDSAAQGNGTNGGALHYSLPYGYWTLAANVGSSRYFQSIAGLTQNYIYSGTSQNTDLKLSRLVYRDAVRKTTLSLKAWQRKSNNFIDDTEVEVQRRVMGGWELGVGHKEFFGQATVEANLNYKVGTSDFGAIPAPEEAFGEGTAQFGIVSLDANASLPFQVMGTQLRYSGALRVQDNTTRLLAQDRFSIGGRYSVRGFDGDSSLSAERGWTLRNEISTGIAQGLGIGAQQIYLGVDAGEVSGRGAETLLGNTLAGAVIGLRGAIKKVQYEVFVGGPISKPNGFTTAETTFGFNLSLGL
jgi:hemolysin activation/secretion protein